MTFKILSRKGLEASVCECYQIVKTEGDRLLGTGNTPVSS